MGPSTIESPFDGPPPHATQGACPPDRPQRRIFATGRSFGEGAVKLAGLAARLLGWTPEEFWRATPAELAAALHDDTVEPVAGEELARLRERFPDG